MTKPVENQRMGRRKAFQVILVSFGLLLSGMTLASLLGRLHWVLDVFSHFHLQYTIGLAGCLCLLLWLALGRRNPVAQHTSGRVCLLVIFSALVINLSYIVPFWGATAVATTTAPSAGSLRVMVMNISTGTAGYDQVIDLIRVRNPDVVFMSEVRADLVALVQEQLADSHPYFHAVPSRMTLGIAFLSRHPFLDIETIMLTGHGRRYLRAEIAWQGEPVTLVGIHPLPPLNRDWAASRDSELQRMGELANAATQPFVLMGDLNASPWSQPMRQLRAQAELRYASEGYGIWPTWRFAGPVLGAPLDHILVSPQWDVADYLDAGDIGSDHIPLQADLVLMK